MKRDSDTFVKPVYTAVSHCSCPVEVFTQASAIYSDNYFLMIQIYLETGQDDVWSTS